MTTRLVLYHHTHWDREWWSSFEEFRHRLVRAVDTLLDTLADEPDLEFVLDGQMAAVQDYLALRPQRRGDLVEAVHRGQLHVGPWLVLADGSLVSGESVVRNLWLGEHAARALGVKTAPVGYLPDQFGHCAQMPQLLQGFGLSSVVLWRGCGAPPAGDVTPGSGPAVETPDRLPGPRDYRRPRDTRRFPTTTHSEFAWESPDGSRVLGVYLPDEYYQGHFHIHPDHVETSLRTAAERVRELVAYLRPFATTDLLLMPYGGDHLPADPRLPWIVRELNHRLADDDITVETGSLAGYVERLRAAGATAGDGARSTWHGEARAFGRGSHLLPGVLSARLDLKRANAEAETSLERRAEPLQTLGWLYGERYDADALWHAWEQVVLNHAHDSVTGCGTDEVARQVHDRFMSGTQLAGELARLSLDRLGRRMSSDADVRPDDVPVLVFNPSSWERSEVADVDLPMTELDPARWVLLDPGGAPVAFQVRERTGRRPGTDEGRWLRLSLRVEPLPGLTLRRYLLRPSPPPPTGTSAPWTKAPHDQSAAEHRELEHPVEGVVARTKGSHSTGEVSLGRWSLDNGLVRVEISTEDGTLTVTDRTDGVRVPGLHVLSDGGDSGDTYNYSWPLGDLERRTDQVRPGLEWVETGPVRCAARITWDLDLPAGLSADRRSRSTDTVRVRLATEVALAAGSRRVDLRTSWDNRVLDHRVRALFPLGTTVEHAVADGPFEVLERPVGVLPDERGSAEPAVREHPMCGFASAAASGRGVAVLARGLPEYSVDGDADDTLTLTLLRGVGWLSREDLMTRIAGAGPQVPTPEAQLVGEWSVDYALVVHAGDWRRAGLPRLADEHRGPLVGHALKPAGSVVVTRPAYEPRPQGSLPAELSPVTVSGEDVVVTAVKKAEDGNALVIRLVRLAPDEGAANLRIAGPVTEVRRSDLREQPGDPLPRDGDGAWTVPMRAWEVLTLVAAVDRCARGRDADRG